MKRGPIDSHQRQREGGVIAHRDQGRLSDAIAMAIAGDSVPVHAQTRHIIQSRIDGPGGVQRQTAPRDINAGDLDADRHHPWIRSTSRRRYSDGSGSARNNDPLGRLRGRTRQRIRQDIAHAFVIEGQNGGLRLRRLNTKIDIGGQ